MKLTDQQVAQLSQVAASAPEHWRDDFLLGVAAKLDGYRQPSKYCFAEDCCGACRFRYQDH
jgi:hypothetical protein